MAFNRDTWVLESAGSYDTLAPQEFSYKSADSLTTQKASAYFNDVRPLPHIGDSIYLYDTNLAASDLVRVTAVSPNITVTDAITVAVAEIPLANTHILVGNASGVAVDVAMSSDATIANTGAVTIANSAITNAKVSASAAIDFSKLATLTSTNILVGSAGNVATSVAMSGDITIGNTGVTAIGASKVLSSMVSPLLMRYATVAITAAEFNGAYATPHLLLAAGGANTLIVVHKVTLLMTYGSVAFADGGVAAVQYDSTANGAGIIASSTLSAATFFATASTGFVFNGGVVPATFTTCVNKGLYLSNVTGAFTGGTGSAFVAHIQYSIFPTV